MPVAVIGGGITGLAAAWHLRQSGIEGVLLEKSGRLGGCIDTERYEGFIIEHGPDVFPARKPEVLALCRELGVPVQHTRRQNRGAYIRRAGRLYRLPEGLSGLVPTQLWPLLSSNLLSLRGRLRALLDLVVPRRQDTRDESVAAFFTRRLGKEAFAGLIEPVLGGITGGDAEHLSMEALFPQLRAAEQRYGSLLLGLSGANPPADTGTPLQSIPGGLSTLVEVLEARLGAVVQCGSEVNRITRKRQMWYVHRAGQEPIRAEAVIMAVPAWCAAPLVESLNANLATELAAIPYSATVVANLAFPKPLVEHALDGYGYLVSWQELSPVAACTWSSSKLADRAPTGHVLLRVFLAGVDVVHWSDEAVVEAAKGELQLSLGILRDPSWVRLRRYPKAMPQYVLGHSDRWKRIGRHMAEHTGLYIAGPMERGIGIADCIRSGRRAADRAMSEPNNLMPE